MAKGAIFAVVFGAMLFALGVTPGVIATFFEELRNFRDTFSPTRGPIHGIQTDSPQMGWLSLGE